MASISRALQRIKDDLQPFVPDSLIVETCLQLGHHWRERQLDPVTTIQLFVLQVLHLNTAINGLRRVAKVPVSAAAYCKARIRLPLGVLQVLLRRSAQVMRGRSAGVADRWCGLRAWLVDGSSTITPDVPALAQAFGYPGNQKPGCGFPVPKILGMFDAVTGLMIETLCFPLFTHEASKVWRLHPLLGPGDLLVGDRGFCSFVHLALLGLRNVQGLFRLHQKQIADFRPHRQRRRKGQKGRPSSRFVRRLGKYDQIVEWFRPAQKPVWMNARQWASLPETLLVRELRYSLSADGQRSRCVTLATTLLDPVRFPKEKIAALYGIRWTVETHFAELKTTLKMRKLKCRSVQGVRKELAIYSLVYNLVHMIMLQAARRQKVSPDRISFIDTLRWLSQADPHEPLPHLLVNPRRPHRHQPRVIKDRNDTYPRMTQPRWYLKKHPGYYGR
jgi:Transposase DDE domain